MTHQAPRSFAAFPFAVFATLSHLMVWLASSATLAQTLPVTNGLKLWLKADAGLTTNNSAAVTTGADQSGLGNHATAPADLAKAPTVEWNTLNGKPTLRFGGGTRYLYLNDFLNGHGAYTVAPSDGGGPLCIGARADRVSQLKGNLAEVLIHKPALSAADRTAVIEYLRTKSPEKQPEVDAFYRRQLTELLTKYGTLFEVWFDGGCRVPVNDLLDKYAPDVVTLQGRRRGSARWVGNEEGHAPYPCWSTVNWQEDTYPAWGGGVRDGNWWAPAECDVSILRPNWFWSPGCDGRILSLESLMEIYYLSVGRNAVLLLNVTPDDHGAIPEAQIKRLAEFGDDIRARFDKPLATTSGAFKDTTGSLVLAFDGQKTVDHVRLREDIRASSQDVEETGALP